MAQNTIDPREIDTELAALHGTRREATERRASTVNTMHRTAGDKKTGQYGTGRWITPNAEIIAQVEAMAADESTDIRARAKAQHDVAALAEHDAEIEKVAAEIEPLNAIYREHRWSRFFLVEGPNGHIHSSTECSTCNHRGRPTRFSWLPELSSKTEADAVESQGARLCSTCFPTAPVEWTNHWELEEARKLAASCPGSGTRDWIEGSVTKSRKYAKCQHCGELVSLTPSNKFRKHNPKK